MTRLGESPLGHLGFWAAAAVIVMMGWGLQHASQQAEDSSRWVDHTFEALALASGVSESLGRAQVAGPPDREAALVRAEGRLGQLRLLTVDNPAQQRRVILLGELVRDRAALMDNPARAHAVVDEIRLEELRLLAARRADQLASYRTENLVLAAFIVIGLVVLVPAYVGFVRESRARVRAEGSLRDLAESLPGAVFQYRKPRGAAGRYEFVTSSAARVHGVDAKEALRNPRALLESILEEDRPRFIAAMQQGERTLAPVEVDYRVNGLPGGVRWIRTTAAPRRSEDGSLIWSGHWGDVTEKKELVLELRDSREAAESANLAKSVFLATMSHEIRTPMNGVLGMLELLSLTQLDSGQRTTLGVIRESGITLLRIIDDILDFSKIEAGKLELRPEPASIAAIVERIRNLYAGSASSKGIAIEHSVDARISPLLMADSVRLQQILGNFTSNAIKFTSAGKVAIAAELAERVAGEEVVRFTVTDTGIGITDEEKALLFEPFAQVRGDQAASRHGGTGLGLSICRRLATLMGGAIDLESAPGRGTTMYLTVRLPVAPDSALSPETPRAPEARTFAAARVLTEQARVARGATRVMVVDDHPINRMVLQRQVEALGYAAQTAASGGEAFEKWSGGGFAAVVTDCNMPGMDGYQLAGRIREVEVAEGRIRTVIIACTANAIAGEAEKCLGAGMDDYVSKPVELARLERKLAQWLPDSNPDCPIEGSLIAQLSGGDPEVEREVVRRFRGCHVEDAGHLRAAIGASDFDRVVGASHRIQGASRTIGAMALASVCERLERAGRARDPAVLVVEMPRFEHENHRLEAYLKGMEA